LRENDGDVSLRGLNELSPLPRWEGLGEGESAQLPANPLTGALIRDLFCEDSNNQVEQNKDIPGGKKDQQELNDTDDQILFPEKAVKTENEEKNSMTFLSKPLVPGRNITMQNVNPGCEVFVHEEPPD
jgi:hypothetical protein